MSIRIDNNGYYGEFGGAFIPEMMHPNIEELQNKYIDIITKSSFVKEYKSLLKDYVGRPSPLFYAERLSEKYNAHIYLKREDLNHTGSHKINNTIGQILLAQKLGKKRIIAETGAGQHGVATATVCALKNMECVVYMGEEDVERQAPNVARIKMLGAKIVPVNSGSKTLKDATNGALRDWIFNPIEGDDLIPENGPITVVVSIVAPSQQNQQFSGEVKIVNKKDNSDYCLLHTSIATLENLASIESQNLKSIEKFSGLFLLSDSNTLSPFFNELIKLMAKG